MGLQMSIRKMSHKCLYMHTVNGLPAYFNGEDIVPISGNGMACPMVKRKSQIQREQRTVQRVLKKKTRSKVAHYGYVRLQMPYL